MYYIFKLGVADDQTLLLGLDYNNIGYSTTRKNMVVKIKSTNSNDKHGLLVEVGVTQESKAGAMYVNDIYQKLDTAVRFSSRDYNPHPGDILISENGEFVPVNIFTKENGYTGTITFKNLVFDSSVVQLDDMIITKDKNGDMTFKQPVISSDDNKGISIVNNQFRVNVGKNSLDTVFMNDINEAIDNYKANISYVNITTDPTTINNDSDSIYINTKFDTLGITLTTNSNISKIITIFSDTATTITFDANSSIPLYTFKGKESTPVMLAKTHILYFDGINKSVYILNAESLNDASALHTPTLNVPGIINTNKSEFLFDQVNDDVVDRIPNVVTPYSLKQNLMRLTNKLDDLFTNMNIPEIKNIGTRAFKGIVEYNHGELNDSRMTADSIKKELVSNTADTIETEETYKRSILGLNNPENIDLMKDDIDYTSTSSSIIEVSGILQYEDEIRLTMEGITSYKNNTKRTKNGSVDSDSNTLDHIKVTPINDINTEVEYYSKVTIRNINNNYLLTVDIETTFNNGVKFENTLTVNYFTISDIAFSKWNTDLISKDKENTIYLITNMHDNNTIITKKNTKLTNSHGNNVFFDIDTKEFSERTNNQVLLPRYNSIVTPKDKVDLDLRNNNNYDVVGKNIKNVNIYNPTKNVLQHNNIYKFFSTNNEMNVKVDGDYDIELFSSPTGSSDYGIDTKQSKFCVLDENKDKVFDVGYGNTIVDTRENQSMITDTAIVSQSNIVNNAIIDQTLINENNVIDNRPDWTEIDKTNVIDNRPDWTKVNENNVIRIEQEDVALSWECAQDHCTGAVTSNPNYNDVNAIFLDKANLGTGYYVFINYGTYTSSNPYTPSNIVLDEQLRPYKLLYVASDPKGIMEDNGWKDRSYAKAGGYILTPMYTDTDGEYYFFFNGKKCKGPIQGAEVCGKVIYLTGDLGIGTPYLNVHDNVYFEKAAKAEDHKPIQPVKGDANIQVATSWECAEDYCTAAIDTNPNYNGGSIICLDQANLGADYHVYINYGTYTSSSPNAFSIIVLDDQLRPYKLLAVNRDPKGIMEDGWKDISYDKEGNYIFIPMYTDTDGVYYFFFGGKKYKGPNSGAEVYGKVEYILGAHFDLNVHDNVYFDKAAKAEDHKPILPNISTKSISWECAQDHCTGDVVSNPNDGSNYICLDKANLGDNYRVYINYGTHTSSNPFDASNIILDDQLRPYKYIGVFNDPKGIMENNDWKDRTLREEGEFILIPMYTDTDGIYYFFFGGKKYKGSNVGAEVCGKVEYITQSDYGLNVHDNVYFEKAANASDHKPIYAKPEDKNVKYGKVISEDANITYKSYTSDEFIRLFNMDNYKKASPTQLVTSSADAPSLPVSFQSLDYTVLDYDQLRYFPNYNTDSAYNVMITQKDNLIKIRLLDDKLVNYNMFIKVNNEYSSFENINIPVDDTLIYAGAFTTKQDGFKNDELIIAYLVKDNKSDYLLKYNKYVRVKELMTLSNEHALVFQLDSTGILNDSYIADAVMSRSSITRSDFIKSVFVKDYDIYILHQNGYVTKFSLENINHKLTLRALSTSNSGVNNAYKEDLFVDFYNNYYVRNPTDNTYAKVSYTGGLINDSIITSSTGIYEFNGRIYPNKQSNKLIYGDIQNDLVRAEVKSNLYTICKLKNNIYVMIMIDGSMKVVSNNKMQVLDVPYHRDQKYLEDTSDNVLSTNIDNVSVNTTNVVLSNSIASHNNTGVYSMKNGNEILYDMNDNVTFTHDQASISFTRDPDIDLFIHEIKDFHITQDDSYILYRNAVVKLDDTLTIVKDTNLICFITYDNRLAYLQNINDEIIIKDIKKGKALKRLTTGNTFTELVNRFNIDDKEYLLFNDGSILLNYDSRLIHSEVNITPGDDIILEDDLVYLIRDGYRHNHNNELNHFIKGEHINLNTILIENTVLLELVNDNVFLNANKHDMYNILNIQDTDIYVNDRKTSLLSPGKYIFILRMEDLDNSMLKTIFKRLKLKIEHGVTLVNIANNISLSDAKEITLEYMRDESLNNNS